MSKHRDLVRKSVDSVGIAIAPLICLEMAYQLWNEKIDCIQVALTDVGDPPTSAREFSIPARQILANALERTAIPELTEAVVLLRSQYPTRQSTCLVEGSVAKQQTLQVAIITVRTRIRTKWVHMWHEQEVRMEWPVGWAPSTAA